MTSPTNASTTSTSVTTASTPSTATPAPTAVTTILVVEDDPASARLVRTALAAGTGGELVWTGTLAGAVHEMNTRSISCVVVDLGLPDGGGLELVDALLSVGPDVPIVVLTDPGHAALAVAAVHRGAQDYVLKSELTSRVIGRAVSYAMERAGIREALARNEVYYRAMIDSLGEGVMVFSVGGRVLTANAAATRLLGLTTDELVDRDVTHQRWHLVDEHGRPLPDESRPDRVVQRTGQPVVDVTVGVHVGTDAVRWMEVSAFPMRHSPHSTPHAVVVSCRDITAKRAAIERTELQASLLDAAGQAIMAFDRRGIVTYWNRAAEQQCGWAAGEAIGRSMIELTAAPGTAARIGEIAAALSAGQTWTGDLDVLRRDGTTFPAMVTDTPFFDAAGQITAFVAVATDISERKQAEEVMRRLSAIVESSGDAIIGQTLDATIVSWNRGAEQLFGYAAEDVIGRHVGVLVPDTSPAMFADVLTQVELGQTVQHLEVVGRRQDGRLINVSITVSPVFGPNGNVVGCSGIARDITIRTEAQRALKHQALHDALTGLPNRLLLDDRINQAMARAQRHGERVAVLLLDLDGFKLVNDGLGHLAGDELLVEVARRLLGCVRPDDTVARFGGDEFVIVCETASADVASDLGERVLRSLRPPFSVQGVDIFVTASVGLVVASSDAQPIDLIRDADAAMYRAKDRGRSRIELFDEDLRTRAAAKLQSATELRRALERGELEVYYQPILSIDDCRPRHVEALVRWRNPERGIVSPLDFISLAEDTGMIVPIGQWVLQQSLDERARWESDFPALPPLRLAVNISARQLSEPKLVDEINSALVANGTDPSSLILEITESVLMHDPDSLSTLNAIHDLGISLHVDDFGTGYSSLAYLKTLPVDALKIDRAFVDGLGTDTDDQAIITAIVALARALSLGVVAEGIETHAQLRLLRELGCDDAQGFLFARPMPYDRLVCWLRDHTAGGPPSWPT